MTIPDARNSQEALPHWVFDMAGILGHEHACTADLSEARTLLEQYQQLTGFVERWGWRRQHAGYQQQFVRLQLGYALFGKNCQRLAEITGVPAYSVPPKLRTLPIHHLSYTPVIENTQTAWLAVFQSMGQQPAGQETLHDSPEIAPPFGQTSFFRTRLDDCMAEVINCTLENISEQQGDASPEDRFQATFSYTARCDTAESLFQLNPLAQEFEKRHRELRDKLQKLNDDLYLKYQPSRQYVTIKQKYSEAHSAALTEFEQFKDARCAHYTQLGQTFYIESHYKEIYRQLRDFEPQAYYKKSPDFWSQEHYTRNEEVAHQWGLKKERLPSEFICKHTGLIIDDPVILHGQEGVYYERSVVSCLENNPTTGEYIHPADVQSVAGLGKRIKQHIDISAKGSALPAFLLYRKQAAIYEQASWWEKAWYWLTGKLAPLKIGHEKYSAFEEYVQEKEPNFSRGTKEIAAVAYIDEYVTEKGITFREKPTTLPAQEILWSERQRDFTKKLETILKDTMQRLEKALHAEAWDRLTEESLDAIRADFLAQVERFTVDEGKHYVPLYSLSSLSGITTDIAAYLQIIKQEYLERFQAHYEMLRANFEAGIADREAGEPDIEYRAINVINQRGGRGEPSMIEESIVAAAADVSHENREGAHASRAYMRNGLFSQPNVQQNDDFQFGQLQPELDEPGHLRAEGEGEVPAGYSP